MLKTIIEDTKQEIIKIEKSISFFKSYIFKDDELKDFRSTEVIEKIFNSATINVCIYYEAFTADVHSFISRKPARYNHPWANTREIAAYLKIDISSEYKIAHDAWEYYNSLKHINKQMERQKDKIFKKYNLRTSQEGFHFVTSSILKLLDKLSTYS